MKPLMEFVYQACYSTLQPCLCRKIRGQRPRLQSEM